MKYKVGDKVRVRQWEAMVREFGLDKDGDIVNCETKIKWVFYSEMRQFCGKDLIIKTIANLPCGDSYYCFLNFEEFTFSDWMIEGPAFEYGEEIEVTHSDFENWHKAIYIGYLDGAINPYCVVIEKEDIDLFSEGKKFNFDYFEYSRKIQQPQQSDFSDFIIESKSTGKRYKLQEI